MNKRANFLKFFGMLFGIGFICLMFSPVFSTEKNKGLIGMSLPASFRAFSDDSPWNTTLPEDPEIDPNSDKMIQHLKETAEIIKGDTVKWTMPLFVIDSSVCPWTSVESVRGELYFAVDPHGKGVANNIPIPEGVWPDPGKDAHMILVDPTVGTVWEFSQAYRDRNGVWTASIIDIWDLNGKGFRQPFNGSRWWRSGANGSGTPLISGLIRPEEIAAGEIRHVLLCATPINRKSAQKGGAVELCAPASRSDGYGYGDEYIPEGARIQLDPDLDLDSLELCVGSKIVARAMQEYGMFVGDNARTFKIYFQNMGPAGGPWEDYDYFKDLKNIPVEAFRILKCNTVTREKARRRARGN